MTEIQQRWRNLIDVVLPREANNRKNWPVCRNHCFARILLDNVCGMPWRSKMKAPAWRNAGDALLNKAIHLGEAVLNGSADLSVLNKRSLMMRGKLKRT